MPALWQQPIGAVLALTLLTAAGPAAADEDASGRGEYLVRRMLLVPHRRRRAAFGRRPGARHSVWDFL